MPPRELPKHRYVTVFDKSSGKVRPNGSRIVEPDAEASQAKVNGEFRARKLRPPLKTTKNGWIASDTYEFEKVSKRRRIMVDGIDGGNGNGEKDDEDTSDGETFVAGKKVKPEPIRYSARLRQHNMQDLSFLASNAAADSSANASGSDANADVEKTRCSGDPSSDLLKSIHYYASQFYASSGQLVNSTRKFRLSKAKTKKSKSRRSSTTDEDEEEGGEGNESSQEATEDDDERMTSDDDNSSENSYQDGDEDEDENEGQSDDDEWNDDDDASDADNPKTASRSLPVGKRRRTIQRRAEQQIRHFLEKRDMYRAFDGSALFCIGMLFKAHVISQLQSRIPKDWNDQVAAYEEQDELNETYDSLEDEETSAEIDQEDQKTNAEIGQEDRGINAEIDQKDQGTSAEMDQEGQETNNAEDQDNQMTSTEIDREDQSTSLAKDESDKKTNSENTAATEPREKKRKRKK